MGRIEAAAEQADSHTAAVRGKPEAADRRACPVLRRVGETARRAAMIHQRGSPMMREMLPVPVTAGSARSRVRGI
jgi:acyl transferase domain-containing protein